MKVFGKQHYLAYARYLLLILFDLVSCIILDSSSHGVVTFMGEETEDPEDRAASAPSGTRPLLLLKPCDCISAEWSTC